MNLKLTLALHHLDAASAQFVRDISRHVTRPALSHIERDDEDRILVMAFE